jgi:hypothetical protein
MDAPDVLPPFFGVAAVFATGLATALFGACPVAAGELRGAGILSHPCGQVAVRHMELVHAGRFEEAIRLGTPAMRSGWLAIPATERVLMEKLMKQMARDADTYAADIRAHGLLVVNGNTATLTVTRPFKMQGGSGTETLTQRFLIEGDACAITR